MPHASGRRRYRAFISYSHSDAPVASRLHRRLEGYRVPRALRGTAGEFGPVPERLHPIFRDREELSTAGALGGRLQSALEDADALLVICSPEAARSRWVNEEVLTFKRLGRGDRIYCLIVAGEPHAGDARECFPPALRFELESDGELGQRPAEPIAADIRPGKDGRALARLKLIAGLLGTDLDNLRRRDAQRRHRRLFLAMVAAFAGMALALGLATVAWLARNDAQRRQLQAEDLLGYMVGDLRQKLDSHSRVESLNNISDKVTQYFASLNPRDLNDAVLGQQAEALTQIGQVRLRQGRYPDALASFKGAYERSKALAARHPGNGDHLFDRGQAEYWVGFVYWQSRDLRRAQKWLTRYRDTCRAVYAIDHTRIKWQHELAYGEQVLAVLELDRGQLQSASDGIMRSLGMLEALLAKAPDDPQLLSEVVGQISWLGNVQEQLGNLQQAEVLLATTSETLAQLAAKRPPDLEWQVQWSIAAAMQSGLLLVQGRYAEADTVASGAVKRMQSLTAHDPDNKSWSESYLHALELRAAARFGAGKLALARDDLVLAQPLVDAFTRVANSNREALRDVLETLTLRIALARRMGDHAAALRAAAALQAIYQGQVAPDTPEGIGRYGLSEVVVGMVAADAGRPADAQAHYAAARRALAPLAQHSSYWRVLDPWVRLSLLSGDTDEAARVQKQLADQGYVPLLPWPVVAEAAATNRTDAQAIPPTSEEVPPPHHHDNKGETP